MDKSLVKLLLFIVAAAVLLVLLAPVAMGRTSAWVEDAWTHVRLAASNDVMSVPQETEQKGHVVFVMDDGWETQYTAAYPLFKKYGFPACIAVIPAAVGTDRYLSYQQLGNLYLDGWDMLNHTNNHFNLAGLSKEMQLKQMDDARTWLKDKGLGRGSDILVYPGGAFNQTTLDLMKEEGFAAGRSLKSLWLAGKDCSMEDAEVLNLISNMPFDEVKAAADKAINNRSTIIFMLHKVEPVTDDTHMQIDEEFLEQVLSYISDNSDKLEVVTMSQLLSMIHP